MMTGEESEDLSTLDLALVAGNAALKRVEDFDSYSSLPQEERRDVRQLSWDDLELGPLVGEGAFSSVYVVTIMPPRKERSRLDSFVSFDEDEGEGEEKKDSINGCENTSTFTTRPAYNKQYALKCLLKNVTTEEKSFTCAAIDLALEARMLARLAHENIISLHGVTSGCVSASFSENEGGYFLVLDLMVDTLDHKLDAWEDRERNNRRRLLPFKMNRKEQQKQLDRIEYVALGIAKALEYLHQNNIMYRDLKPQNIGFDENETVRIFDFGLAREVIQEGNKQGVELRQATGEAGTPRYMAPEVARKEGFDFSSDVYSFSLLLWELCTLRKPFDEFKSRVKFENCVVYGGVRPPLQRVMSSRIAKTVQQGWSDDPQDRPSMKVMRETLESVLDDAREKEMARQERRRLLPSLRRRPASEFSSMENTRRGAALDNARRQSFNLHSSPLSSSFSKAGSRRGSRSSKFSLSRHGSEHSLQAQSSELDQPLHSSKELDQPLHSSKEYSGSFSASQSSRMNDSRHSNRSALADAMIETLAFQAEEDKKRLREKSFLRRFFRRRKETRRNSGGEPIA